MSWAPGREGKRGPGPWPFPAKGPAAMVAPELPVRRLDPGCRCPPTPIRATPAPTCAPPPTSCSRRGAGHGRDRAGRGRARRLRRLRPPRSGLASRHGITVVNAPGTVDAGYRGEVKVVLLNTDRAEAFTVRRGDRIAQLVVQPVTRVRFLDVAELPEPREARAASGPRGGKVVASVVAGEGPASDDDQQNDQWGSGWPPRARPPVPTSRRCGACSSTPSGWSRAAWARSARPGSSRCSTRRRPRSGRPPSRSCAAATPTCTTTRWPGG